MDAVATRLRSAFVAAYRPHLRQRLGERGWSVPDEVIAAGESWLSAALRDLLSLPVDDQVRGPLEVFQEAMAIPTRALIEAGIPAVDRDAVAVAALPGDTHDLAPASSSELGEAAWQAHLAWGAAKAAAFRAVVGLLSGNLLDIDRIEHALAPRRVVSVGSHGDFSGLRVVFVDLEHPEADATIAAGHQAGIAVIAYGPHVDDLAMVRARSLGAKDALPRFRFFRDPASLVPRLV